MFSVLIPIKDLNDLVLNNARLLSMSEQVKQILLVNINSSIIELDRRINKTEVVQMFDVSVVDAISKTMSVVNEPNIILLDNNIRISNNFIPTLTRHYADRHLYTFKVNTIHTNNSIETDMRIGNRLNPDMYDVLAMAFSKKDFDSISDFTDGDTVDFAYAMESKGVKLQLLNQVSCYKVLSADALSKVNTHRKEEILPKGKKKGKPKSRHTIFNWKLESDYVHKQGKFEYIPSKNDNKVKYSFILPFMYNGDRWNLFVATIENLNKIIKNRDDIEIIIHETSKERYITDKFVKKHGIVYIYNEIDILFHRAWNLNVPSRYIAKGDFLIFMDGDLLIDNDWIKELDRCKSNECYVGWDVIKNFSKSGTRKYIDSGTIPTRFSRIRTFINPEVGAAAGINIFPKDIFTNIGGWPECFGSFGYGGEDNSLYMKMKNFGYGYKTINATIYHLWHEHRTPGQVVKEGGKMPINSAIVKNQKRMKKVDWIYHTLLKRNYNWGYCEKLEEEFCRYDNPTLIYITEQKQKMGQ